MQDHVSGEMTYVTEGVGGVFGEGILRFDEVDIEIAHSLKRELDDQRRRSALGALCADAVVRNGPRGLADAGQHPGADAQRPGQFYLSGTLTARLNGEVAAEREWDVAIARDLI